jgi:hypothetical protein
LWDSWKFNIRLRQRRPIVCGIVYASNSRFALARQSDGNPLPIDQQDPADCDRSRPRSNFATDPESGIIAIETVSLTAGISPAAAAHGLYTIGAIFSRNRRPIARSTSGHETPEFSDICGPHIKIASKHGLDAVVLGPRDATAKLDAI